MLEWDEERSAQCRKIRCRAETIETESGRTGQGGRQNACMNACVYVEMEKWCKEVDALLSDVTSFPASQNNGWLR